MNEILLPINHRFIDHTIGCNFHEYSSYNERVIRSKFELSGMMSNSKSVCGGWQRAHALQSRPVFIDDDDDEKVVMEEDCCFE